MGGGGGGGLISPHNIGGLTFCYLQVSMSNLHLLYQPKSRGETGHIHTD